MSRGKQKILSYETIFKKIPDAVSNGDFYNVRASINFTA